MAIKKSENIQIYVDESLDHLTTIESDLLQIEKNGAEIDEEIVNKVFRTAHSIKGGAGFLGFTTIKELAHKMENVLGLIRNRKLVPDPDVVNILLKSADSLNMMIEDINGSESVDVTELADKLLALSQEEKISPTENKAVEASQAVEKVAIPSEKIPDKLTPEEARQTEFEQIVKPAEINESSTKDEPAEKKESTRKKQSASFETSLRVNINLLDTLMTLAGELVLSRNQLLKALSEKDYNAVEYVGQQINLITSDLQESVMLTRMQPIDKIFQRFPRQVRDQARTLGKDVELTLEGEDVEVDKTIIEAISDPLTHLVRNAIDHGIELPEERKQIGKPPTGKVVIKAFHEAGLVCLEIMDDGKGLNAAKLTAEAIKRNQISQELADQMSEKEKLNLIFAPGFSTAKKVTDISGRGVGMDVVKTNLDQLGSQIEIDSKLGKGTTFRIKIPLTLAIISSQIIMDGGERYAFPQANLLELIRIPAAEIKDRLEVISNATVLRLRGHLLPLLKLSDILGTEKESLDPEQNTSAPDRRKNLADRRSKKYLARSQANGDQENTETENQNHQERISTDRRQHYRSTIKIAMVDTGFLRYGIVVDQLLDSEEIVVKPLGRQIGHLNIFSGATIMGDGKVALILDIANIAREANLISLEATDRYKELVYNRDMALKNRRDIQDLLIFKGIESEQFAVPLNLVDRIIKVQANEIEQVGGRKVFQYHNRSLILCSIDQVAEVSGLPESENYLVLIFKFGGHEIGIMAMMPVNTVEISIADIDQAHSQRAIMGSIIIEKKSTLLINVYELVHTLFPEWFSQHTKIVQELSVTSRTILFAEDSEFFREQVTEFMEEEGFKVLKAEDGEAAWKLLKKHHAEIGLVVSDIEMPRLDGFGLAERIRQNEQYSHLPIIALTTLASAEDRARGERVGFSDYLVKLDQDTLIRSIYKQFQSGVEDDSSEPDP